MKTKEYPNPFLASCPNFLSGVGRVHPSYDTFRVADASTLTTTKFTNQNSTFKYPVTEGCTFSNLMRHCYYDLRQVVYAGLNSYCTTVPFNGTLDSPHEFAIGLELEAEARDPQQVYTLYNFRREGPTVFDPVHRERNDDMALISSIPCLTQPDSHPLSDPLFSNWLYCRSDGSLQSGVGVEVTTIPLGEKFCLNPHLYDGVTKLLTSIGLQSTYTDRTGLHVHVNRKFFHKNNPCGSSTQAIQAIRRIRNNLDPISHKSLKCRQASEVQSLLRSYRNTIIDDTLLNITASILMSRLVHLTPGLTLSVFRRNPTSYCYAHDFSSNDNIGSDVLKLLEAIAGAKSTIKNDITQDVESFPTPFTSPTGNDNDPITNALSEAYRRGLRDTRYANPHQVMSDGFDGDIGLNHAESINLFLNQVGETLHSHSRVVNTGCAHTLEFRLGSGSLNPHAIYNQVVFIYAMCAFIRRKLHNPARLIPQLQSEIGLGLATPSLKPYQLDDWSLLKEFLTFASHKALTPAVRGACMAALCGNPIVADDLHQPVFDKPYSYVCGVHQRKE